MENAGTWGNKITNSSYVGLYVSPRLKNNIPEIEEIEIFLISNIEDVYDEIDIDEIETNQLCCDSPELKDNNISKNNISHSLCIGICNLLFNNTKNDVQLSNRIIGLLLELNQIINSNDDNNLIFGNLAQRVDNYKTLFTNMKDNKITNLIEPSPKSPKESNLWKMGVYEKLTRSPKTVISKGKKINHVDFVTIYIILPAFVLQNWTLVR